MRRILIAVRIALILIVSSAPLHPASATFIQQGAKLVGNGATGPSSQGQSVAISADGNTAVIGGPEDSSFSGAAWIYVRNNGVWTQQGGKLAGAGNVGSAGQGTAVAISADGNTVIVAGYADASFVGAAWVFVRSNGVWSAQGGKLVGSGATGAAQQGRSVALSADGNTALIGGPADNSSLGATWVFSRSAGTWAQNGPKLVGLGSGSGANQGHSVALSADGNTALIGGYGDNGSVGAAWVFTRNAGTWLQFGNKLLGTGNAGASQQGFSVALSGDGKTAMIGGPGDNNNTGAVWAFVFNGSVWTQQGAKLVGAGGVSGPIVGVSVALSADGSTALAGGSGDGGGFGAIWVFSRSNGVWSQQANKLIGTGADIGNQGYAVAVSADGSTGITGGLADHNYTGAAWAWIQAAAHDLNGDGKSDIVWRNTLGEAGIWFMNGPAVAATPSLGVIPNNWSIVGQRDVNGDGKSDLLWLNSAGDIGVWFMNASTVTSAPTLSNVGTTWSVVGTGDFDGDGTSDILWRNASGDLGIWFMHGASYTPVSVGNVPTNWSVNGTADFDGDGNRDILWRNTSNDIGIWLMKGATIMAAPTIGNVGPTWSVVGLGDFNGDGKGDILWRNTASDLGIWFMNGTSLLSAPTIGNVSAAWSVASVGDYNADGKSDILLRSSSNDVGIWFMNGASVTSAPILGNVGPSWQVQNAASN